MNVLDQQMNPLPYRAENRTAVDSLHPRIIEGIDLLHRRPAQRATL